MQIRFDTTVIWDDSQEGYGPVQFSEQAPSGRWAFRYMPRGTGRVAKLLGEEPGNISLSLNYCATPADIASIRSTFAGLIYNYGTVQIRGVNYPNYILESYTVRPGQFVTVAGVDKRLLTVDAMFQRLRND